MEKKALTRFGVCVAFRLRLFPYMYFIHVVWQLLGITCLKSPQFDIRMTENHVFGTVEMSVFRLYRAEWKNFLRVHENERNEQKKEHSIPLRLC